jgi:NitT/TauT family transport system ATP-binding protein
LEDSPVAFDRPRTIAMTFEPEFVKLNQQLRDLIVVARASTPAGSTAP